MILSDSSIGQNAYSDFSISRLNPDDGLSQGSNYFRYEDSEGFMWITANDAINRYDGKMVKVYNLNKYFTHCPNLQQGYGFAEDSAANIYVGSTRGLYIYHRDRDKFTLCKIFENSPDEVAMPIGYRNGKIWCFNRQYELATYDVRSGKVQYVIRANMEPIPSVHIYQMRVNPFYYRYPFLDTTGNIWMIGTNALCKYHINDHKLTYLLKDYISNNQITFYSCNYDKHEYKILFGLNKGILNYDLNSGEVSSTTCIGNNNLGTIVNICADAGFIAFVDIDGSGLCFTDKKYKTNLCLEPSGPHKYLRCNQFSFDKSGRLWMCDDGQGQLIFDFLPRLMNKAPNEFLPNYNLLNAGVANIVEMPDGNMLIQSNIVQDRRDGSFYPLAVADSQIKFFRSVLDTFHQGIWFFGDAFHGIGINRKIFFRDRENKLLQLFSNDKLDTLGTQQDLHSLPDGSILCAFSKGLYWLDIKTRSLLHISDLPGLNPFKINPLSDERLAISYLNRDMLLVTKSKTGSLKPILKILPGIQSFYIQQDEKRKRYWVGTNQGIYLLDQDFRTVKVFDANNGLAGTYIYGLLLDDSGTAWCSHQRGMSSINGVSYQIINYDKSDGIQDWDFNNRAFCKASDGTLFFGGVKGFNYFKPPLKPSSFYHPQLYVDEILVNGKTYQPDTNADNIHDLNLDYQDNNISIRAIIRDLGNAAKLQVIYRFAEKDRQWTYMTNNSIISFNSLAPGEYTLELGTYDKYSDLHIPQKTISFIIHSPFYLTVWFWSFMAMLLSGLAFYAYNRRKLFQQKTKYQQQLALDMQRAKITADLHDDIGASLSSLQVNSAVANQLILKDPEKAQMILDKIERQSKELAESIGDIIWSLNPDKDQFMTMSARIKNFANDILGSIDIYYEIKIDNEADLYIRDITIRKNIVLIAKEAINNIAKYSKATNVLFSIRLHGHEATMVISDNGAGFDQSAVMGNGLRNIRKRAEEIQAHLIIDSIPNLGTKITIKIPVP